MSEKGCLLSKSFNTLSTSNQTEIKELFTKNHIKASVHINRDKDGIIMKENKDIFHQSTPNSHTTQSSHLHHNGISTPNQVHFPSKSIIESITIILKQDNFSVKSATTTDVALRISISDDNGATYNALFDDSAGGEVVLLPGKRNSDNGSFVSINTIIPIISNYRYNDRLDKYMAISTGGFVSTDNINNMELTRSSGDDGNSNAVPQGTLYNDSDTDKLIDIQLLTIGNQNHLDGFAQSLTDGGPREAVTSLYNSIRTQANRSSAENDDGGKFTALVTFTKLL